MEPKKYIINGKTYYQKQLVIRQVKQLLEALERVVFDDLSVEGIIRALGDSMPGIAAIILIPEGVKIKNKDLDALAEEFENELSLETTLEVVGDFLAFNPISSILSNLSGAITAMAENLKGLDIIKKTVQSIASPGNSAAGISSKETG